MEVIFYQILGGIRMNEEKTLSTMLEEEYLREREILQKMQEENEVDLDRYEVQVKRVNDLEGRLLENRKQIIDHGIKMNDMMIAENNSKAERKIKVLGITAPIAAGMIMGFASMHWEKVESMLYTVGKAAFRDIMKFRK